MHQLVAGLSGVEVIADDFVVVGFRDSMEDASVGHSRACLEEVVEGLSDVEVIADDFVVVGFRDSMEDASVGSRAVWCRGHS